MSEAVNINAQDRPSTGSEGREARARDSVRRGFLQRLLYEVCLQLSRIGGILLYDIRTRGAHRVPRRGPVVVASNHQSFLDPWLVGMCLPRHSYYLARDSLFRFPLFGGLIWSLNALPIPRGTAASRGGLEMARGALRGGKAIVLFPEGTRTRDGAMGPLKRGLELVTRSLESWVVPVLVEGSFRAWPPHRRLPGFAPVRIQIGEPIRTGGADEKNDRAQDDRRVLNDELCGGLMPRLSASYQSLEAGARRSALAGAARAGGRPHFFG